MNSQCDASTLTWLGRREITRAKGRDFGTIPGEACGFIVVKAADQMGGMVLSAAHVEWSEVDSQASAAALCRALEATLQPETLPKVVMLDTAGLPGQAESWAMASMRTLGRRGVAPRLLEPGLSLGDIGAATLPVYLGLLSHDLAGDTLVTISGGLQGNRGALLVEPGVPREAAT